MRILCYHGFSIGDEDQFWPPMFMNPLVFRRHMEILFEKGHHLLSLQDALRRLQNNNLPPGSIVITFDDGFYSIYKEAIPYLLEKKIPATVYVTTYYCLNQKPIFRLVIQYMFWKTYAKGIDLSVIGFPSGEVISIETESDKKRAMSEIIRFGETALDERARCILAEKLGNVLGVRYEDISESRCFSIMDQNEIAELVSHGIDIQLHTHRHRLPEDEASVRQEIRENRSVLEPLVGRRLTHLCYPSGIWTPKHYPVLQAELIESAVTCDSGFNYSDTPRLGLRRFLDNSYISETELEAELCGVNELIRPLKRVFTRFLKLHRHKGSHPLVSHIIG